MTLTGSCVALLLSAAPCQPDGPDVTRITGRNFTIPFQVDPGGRRVQDFSRVELYVSWDKGKTWEMVAAKAPKESRFIFHSPRDGLAWFATRLIDVQGKAYPEKLGPQHVAQKVLIDTRAARPLDPTKDTPEARKRLKDLDKGSRKER